MEEQLLKANTEYLINGNLTAALLGARIPWEKVDHPSLPENTPPLRRPCIPLQV